MRQAVLNYGVFSDDWKKGNIFVPVHKKDLKTMLIQSRPQRIFSLYEEGGKEAIFKNCSGDEGDAN